jgi:hypothetical protein
MATLYGSAGMVANLPSSSLGNSLSETLRNLELPRDRARFLV